MSEILFFLKYGWKNIWEEKSIFLFSSLTFVGTLLKIVPLPKNILWLFSFLSLGESLVTFAFYLIGTTGMVYIAYCISVGEPVTIYKTLQTASKFLMRVAILSFLLIIPAIPLLGLIFAFSSQPPQPPSIVQNIYLAAIPLSIFNAWWFFSLAEIVINNFGIRKSIKNAWTLFIAHFGILACMGILLIGLWQIVNIAFGMAAILIQSNFDITALGTLNYISPSLSFPNSGLYKLMYSILGTFGGAFNMCIFIFAYVKYSGIKPNRHA